MDVFAALLAVLIGIRLLWTALVVRYAINISAEMPILVWRTFDEVVALGCPRLFAPKVLALLVKAKVLEWRYASNAPDSIRSRSPHEWGVKAAETRYYEYRRTSPLPPKPRDLLWKNKEAADDAIPEPI